MYYETEKKDIVDKFNSSKLNCEDKESFSQGFVKLILNDFKSSVNLCTSREYRKQYDFRCIFSIEYLQSELQKIFDEVGTEVNYKFTVNCSVFDWIDFESEMAKAFIISIMWKRK